MSADLAAPPVDRIAVDAIVVGQRARRDYGDLSGLIASIREVGLLQPIGIAPGNHLLFGGRRLEACRRLGWTEIPVTRPTTRTDALSLLKAERDENTCRKDMTPEELVDLGMRLEELERPKAEERMREAAARGRATRWDGPESNDQSPQNDKSRTSPTVVAVGAALGLAPPTYRRMKTVVTAAREETDPEVQTVAQKALSDLNAGRTTPFGAVERIRKARNAEPESAAANSLAIPQPPRMGGNRRKHLQILQAMTTTLAGLAGAVDEVTELDSTVTKEEATQLLRDLSQQIRSLNQIRNLLKERTR